MNFYNAFKFVILLNFIEPTLWDETEIVEVNL
jgi:hypothetical protein